ncbi:MAG: putative metal-binding motif-containing protein [Pseudomonadota bacterium]
MTAFHRPLIAVALGLLVPTTAWADSIQCEDAQPSDCLTIWQAHALGYLTITSASYSGVRVGIANGGSFDVCVDDQALYTADLSQSFFLDDDITDGGYEIAAGSALYTYYGSWTTPNGYYYPYYGYPAWWCVEYGQYAAAGATYDYYGEQIPDALAYYISTATDTDGDGRTDKNDWAGTYGVQANYNIWAYQNSYAILTAGKTAQASGCDVEVNLISRNLGYYGATGTLTDTVPAGWTASDYSTWPSSIVANADGTTTLTWTVSVSGTYGGIILDADQISYTLEYDAGSDVPYLELPEAYVTFNDGTGTETNYSLPAAAYNLDTSCDGTVSCVEEEVCDGIDNDLDGEIDEGFDEDGDGFADCMEECVVEERFCSDEDGLNLLEDGTPAVLTYDANPRWTARISGAEWIWDEYYETNPGGDEIHSIFRAFSIQPGAWNLDLSLELGADNSYEVWLNGTSVGADPTEYNYFAPTDVWDLTGAAQEGDNSLEWEIWNWAQRGGTAYSNPGGLIYCVDVSYSYEMDPEICDGMDNDCDGLVDDEDPDVTGQGTWYADADGDGFGDPAVFVVSCEAPSGYVTDDTDCDDTDAGVNPGASEVCDGLDDDCDGLVDDDDPDVVGQGTWYADADGDGYGDLGAPVTACTQPSGTVSDATDCDDTDAAINPGAAEVCDGVDNDCDGAIDEGFDSDGDGLADCFDTEECDGLDNDGDGLVDDLDPDVVGQGTWYVDADGDGYGDAGSTIVACAMPTGATTDASDCDDTDAAVNPGATEVCNDLDDDCDGDVDEGLDTTWYAEADGDGYGDPGTALEDCAQPTGYVADGTDCDDSDADINPGAAEECDGLDNDCDGLVDEDFDLDGDGWTTCGIEPECDVLFDLAHGEDTWSDPYNYTTEHAWGFAADDLLDAGYAWDANASSALEPGLMGDYDAMIVAEPVATFSSDEVDAVLDYVYDGGGLLLITDFNEPYINAIANELGVSFHGYSDLIGWTAIDDWDNGHAVSDGIDSVFWAYGSTMSVTDASVQVLATYSGRPVYAVLEYGDGRVVFSADNEVFAAYGFFQIYDPDPTALRDNEDLWMQTMDWLIDCPEAVDPDCDDTDPTVYPGAEELCDGVDNDCDGEIDEGWDEDGDGWTTCEGDCDDTEYTVNPDATEICDGLDDDCDGLVDDADPDVTGQGTWYADNDGDGYGYAPVTACEQPAGTVSDNTDCNDSSAGINPGATEICDGVDDDCDGLVDDADPSITGQGTWYVDADGDGYGGAAVMACGQPAGTVTDSTDCDDTDAAVNPGAVEVCNGLDDDCDGLVDDDDPGVTGQGTWYVDADADGYGSTTVTACTQPSGTVDDATDCDDTDGAINPAATEVCNGYDDDCDGLVDDDDPSVTGQGTWYVDADGDGYGSTTVTACTQPSGTVDDGTDCDDGEASVYPGAPELCDELDNDCDGWVDEGDACVEDCPELEPTDCLTVWQAHARGWLDITSTTSSVVTLTNLGPYDICIDEQVLYTSDDTQSFFAEDDVVATAELAPGDALSLYYGSWTTANGVHQPYLGNDAWWCVEYGQYAAAGASFDWYGEEVPATLAGFATGGWDEDGDGTDDLVDWAGTFGVQANYNVWDWQADHAVLTAGKTASVSGGEVWVTLISRNIGWNDGAGVLTDTIPAGWSVTSWTVDPDTETEEADGSLTVSWAVDVAGTAGGLTVDMADLSYLLARDCPSDLPYLELDPAQVDYFDGDADVTSYSLPAAAYNIDGDGDGVVDCAEEERCDGLDNDLDCEIDEGFDEDGDGFADCMEECVIAERFCSGEDGLNLLEDGSPAVLTYAGNPRWTVSIPDAAWIWDEYYETNPGGDEIHSLFRGFGIQPGAWDLDATLEMGADNSYAVWLNGTAVGSDPYEFNYFAPSDIWDLTSAIQEGENDLEWEVWNWAQPGGSAYSNPGGLLYCVDVSYSYEMDPEICDGMDNDCDGLVDDDDPDIGGQPTWYADADGDGFGDAADTVVSCAAPAGYVADDTDCDDEDADINPGASELCNGLDDDCDGLVDDEDSDVVGQGTWYADADGDGFGDPAAAILACEMPVGSVTDATDCDDTDAGVNPAAVEVCDGGDDDCDGLVDDDDPSVTGQPIWYADADGDSYGDAGSPTAACVQPAGYLADATDCDDTQAAVNPGATEVCNGVDDDCDGALDEGFDSDADGLADCFDTEECDGLDNDGDGLVDDADPSVTGQPSWYYDGDGDGYGYGRYTLMACEQPSSFVATPGDCDDADAAVNPAGVEVCNGYDDDCDGLVDDADASVTGQATWYADADGDGFGDSSVSSLACVKYPGWTGDKADCDDGDAAVNPSAKEICDGYDDDCDGLVDDADGDRIGGSTWHADADGDGYGDPHDRVVACDAPSGYLADGADCDDGDADIHPGAAEVCDGLDQDCDGTVDEDDVCVGEECVEEPPEECLSVWQALSRGWLSVESNETDVGIAFTNEGIYDICLDSMALYTSLDTQDFFLDPAIVDLPAEIVPGDTYTAWYGSWTTENDVYSPYLGEPAWWCAENRTAAGAAVAFGTYGEAVPEVLSAWIEEPQDADGDGVDDLLDWAGMGAVQAQWDIWDWESVAPVMTAGKVAEAVAGDVVVTLTSRNLGDLAGEGGLVDTVPAGWIMFAADRYPDLSVLNADGSLTMAWFVELAPFREPRATTQISYTMAREITADVPYLELEPASLSYEEVCALDATAVFPPDCDGETSWSLPAAVYGVDVDQDDMLTCLP